MPGPPPKPTRLKVITGNPGHRPMNANEPQPTGIPDCPDHLDGAAKAEWSRISEELASIGLLTSVDRAALAAYCQAYSRWQDAEHGIAKHGLVVSVGRKDDPKKSPYPIPSPYVAIANKALELMHKFLCEFGMTPASRTRIQVTQPSAAPDDWDDLDSIDVPNASEIG